MVAPFAARAVDDGAVSRVIVHYLTFEDAAVFEREMEDISLRRVRHWIEPHDRRRGIEILQAVTHAPQVAMTTVQTADAVACLPLRQLRHTLYTELQKERPALEAGGLRAGRLIACVNASWQEPGFNESALSRRVHVRASPNDYSVDDARDWSGGSTMASLHF